MTVTDKDKKDYLRMFYSLTFIGFVFVVFEHLISCKLIHYNIFGRGAGITHTIYNILTNNIYLVRFVFLAGVAGATIYDPSRKLNSEEEKENLTRIATAAILLSILFMLGYRFNIYYAILIYPLIMAFATYYIVKALNKFNIIEGHIDNTVSCEPANDLSYEIMSENGLMRVHKPEQGVIVTGGAGAGKSATIGNQVIQQYIQKNITMLIYDFKGNPPTLGRIAYNCLIQSKLKNPQNTLKFAIVNFANLRQSVRCNPIDPKYIKNVLFIKEAATNILFNINRDWVKKKDFWADNAISIFVCVVHMLRDHHPKQCTLPHVISIILSDEKKIFNWLLTDSMIAKDAAPVITAFKNEAAGQIAGAMSSVQLPMTVLRFEELYWILSADEFDLDISNKENPRILCVANNEPLKDALAPAIGLIISTCLKNMNIQGKNKACLMMDEFVQIFLPQIWDFPATARSKGVVTFLLFQLYSQLKEIYGDNNATSILGNLGTQHHGMTNELKLAEEIAKMFGERTYKDMSTSESDSGSSESISNKKEKIYQARDIMEQESGGFANKVANGKPAFFKTRFGFIDYYPKGSTDLYYFPPKKQKSKNAPPKIFLFKTVDIPDLITKEMINDHDFNEMIKANFHRIDKECEEILAPY